MHARVLGASLTLLAIVWLWLAATSIPDIAIEGAPGPRAFPFLLGVILAILGLALALQPGPRGPGLHPSGSAGRTRIAITTFALLIAYAFLLDRAGFIASTIAVMVIAMAGILGMRRWLLIGSLAVGFTFGCWVVFVTVLGVPLPGGTWMQ